ncbi:hypothetical protein GHT06_004567 [Daphnia sinensis]|uniref:Uncharacterized protein n=1 Tax=Daphnia sinensis TaxID=1820382 RepID=A0AAD5KUS6_9CRUS|nr:hypothetical protein GHT06_004567 [Daphnia sinensis]
MRECFSSPSFVQSSKWQGQGIKLRPLPPNSVPTELQLHFQIPLDVSELLPSLAHDYRYTGLPLLLKYDYQETQTVWKTRMDIQDQLWSKNRTSLHQSIIESLPVCKEAACSNCRRIGSTPVKCQTCRTHLFAACDKVVHSKTVIHQRVCEVKGSLHQMLPTEFLNNVDSLETIKAYTSSLLNDSSNDSSQIPHENVIPLDQLCRMTPSAPHGTSSIHNNGSTRIITDTPEKDKIEEDQRKKEEKEKKKEERERKKLLTRNIMKPSASKKGSYFSGSYLSGSYFSGNSREVIKRMASLAHAETYKHTHLQQLKSVESGAAYFCNDVVCKFKPFCEKITLKFPERKDFQRAATAQKWFLSRFHGRAHSWDCRVLHFGHRLNGAADFLGEEQEQLFAIQGRRAATSKHMSLSARRDDVSQAAFYSNESKDMAHPQYLVKCYLTAVKNVPIYESKLEKRLIQRQLTRADLPCILELLKSRAQISLRITLQQCQTEIEGEAHMVQILKAKNDKCLDSNKARTRNRKEMRKSGKTIDKCVALLSSKFKILVTEKEMESGMFSWNLNGSSTVAEDYDLIDDWMLSLSLLYAEAIELNKNEMAMFIRSCDRLVDGLYGQIQQRKIDREKIIALESLLSVSLDLLQRREISRVLKNISDATDLFEKVVDGFTYEDEGFLDRVEKGEAEELLFDAGNDYADSTSDTDDSDLSSEEEEDSENADDC